MLLNNTRLGKVDSEIDVMRSDAEKNTRKLKKISICVMMENKYSLLIWTQQSIVSKSSDSQTY